MRRGDAGRAVAVARPVSALISAALLLLTVVAGGAGLGGFAALGRAPAAPAAVAAASTIAVPVAGDRRSAPALSAPGTFKRLAGGAPQHPDAADLPAADRRPSRFTAAAVEAEPAVIALTLLVSHRGRAPPAGLPLSQRTLP